MGFARTAGRVYGQARKTWQKPKPKEREYSAQDFSGKDKLVNLRARKNDRTYELLVDDKDVYVAYDDQKQGKTRYKKAMSVGGFTSINPGKPGPQKQWAKTYQGSGGEYFGFDAVAKHLKDTGYDFQVLDKRPMKMRERTRKGDMPDIFGEYIDPRRAHNTSESYYRDSNFKSYRPESLDEKIEIVKKWRKEQKEAKKPKMADVPDDSAKQTTQDSQPGVKTNGMKTKARPWRHPSDQNPGPGWEGEVIDVDWEEPIRKNTMGGPNELGAIAYQNAMKALDGPRKAIGYSGSSDETAGEIGNADPLKQLGVNKPAAEIETYTPNWQAKLGKPKSAQSGRKAWRKKAEQQIKQARAEQQLTDSQQKTAGEPLQLGYTPSDKRLTNLSEQDKEMKSLFANLGMPSHGGQNQANLETDKKMWRKRVKNIGKSLVESAESGEPLPPQIDDQAIKDVESYFGRILDKHAVNDPEFENPTEKVKYAQKVLSVTNRNTTQAAIGNIPQKVVNDITGYQKSKVRGEGIPEGQVRLEGFQPIIDGLRSQAAQENDPSMVEALLKKASDLEKQKGYVQLSKDMKTGQVEDSPLTNADILNMADPQRILTQSREYPDPDLEIADIGEATDLSVDPLAEIDARAAKGRQKVFTSTDINRVDPKTIAAFNIESRQYANNPEDVAYFARTSETPSLYEDPLGGLGDRYNQIYSPSDEQQFGNYLSGNEAKAGRFDYKVGPPELQPEGDYTPEQKIANQVADSIAAIAGLARSQKMVGEGYRLGLEQGDNSKFMMSEGALNKNLDGSIKDVSKQESTTFGESYQKTMDYLANNPGLIESAESRQIVGDIVDRMLNDSANSAIRNLKNSQILNDTTGATAEDIQNAIRQQASGNEGIKSLEKLIRKSEHGSQIVGELRQRIDEAKGNNELALDAVDRYFNGDPTAQNIAQANRDFADSTDDFNRRFAESLIQDDPQSLDAQNAAANLGIDITPPELPPEQLSAAQIEMDLDSGILNDVTGMSEIYVSELPDDIESELYSDGSVGAANDINYNVVSRNEDTGVVTRDKAVYDNTGSNSIIVRNGAEFVITDANNPSDQKVVRLDSQPDLFQKLVSLTGVSTRVKNPVTYTDGPTQTSDLTGEELAQEVINNQATSNSVPLKKGLSWRRNRPQS